MQWGEVESSKQWQCNSKEISVIEVGNFFFFLVITRGNKGYLEGRLPSSCFPKLQTHSLQGGTQEKTAFQSYTKVSRTQSPSRHWGWCLPQRHDPNSCCTSSSLVWHWKHRRRLFCLDRLVSSGRSVFSSSRARFTGEASFSDCESDQNNTCGGEG